jgi:PilZ domain
MKNVQIQPGDVSPELPPVFDRRRRERIALRIPLRILSCGLLTERSDEATCTDLSESGVALETAAQLNVGDIVLLEFHQKGEAAYRCHARLSYRMGRKYGAYFLGGE